MRLRSLLGIGITLVAMMTCCSQAAFAKINVNLRTYYDPEGFFADIERWDVTTGTKVFRYEVIDGFGGPPESVDAITMKSSGQLVAALNSLGHIDITRLNTNTGRTIVPPDYVCCGIGIPFTSFMGPVGDMVFDSHGDLLIAATNFLAEVGDFDQGIIRRFDGTTGLPKGEIVVGDNRYVYSIDASADGSYFYAMHFPLAVGPGDDPNGYLTKYAYSTLNNVFTEVASYITFGSGLDIGPDGILYVGDFNAVNRYDANGQFLDQFIDEYVSDLHWLEGKLIGLTPDSRVVQIDPINGTIIDTLIDASSYSGPGTLTFGSMAAFSVPEPSTVCMSLACLLTFLGVSRQLAIAR